LSLSYPLIVAPFIIHSRYLIAGDFETMQYVFAQLEERMAVIGFDTQVAMDRGIIYSPPSLQ